MPGCPILCGLNTAHPHPSVNAAKGGTSSADICAVRTAVEERPFRGPIRAPLLRVNGQSAA